MEVATWQVQNAQVGEIDRACRDESRRNMEIVEPQRDQANAAVVSRNRRSRASTLACPSCSKSLAPWASIKPSERCWTVEDTAARPAESDPRDERS
jgi:hypothetical protein